MENKTICFRNSFQAFVIEIFGKIKRKKAYLTVAVILYFAVCLTFVLVCIKLYDRLMILGCTDFYCKISATAYGILAFALSLIFKPQALYVSKITKRCNNKKDLLISVFPIYILHLLQAFPFLILPCSVYFIKSDVSYVGAIFLFLLYLLSPIVPLSLFYIISVLINTHSLGIRLSGVISVNLGLSIYELVFILQPIEVFKLLNILDITMFIPSLFSNAINGSSISLLFYVTTVSAIAYLAFEYVWYRTKKTVHSS